MRGILPYNHLSGIDLHVHSCYSRSAGDWLLQQIKSNECYTAPREVYVLAAQRGMDHITLTDHATLVGCKELAHLENLFISEEITTSLFWGLTMRRPMEKSIIAGYF